MIYVPTQETRLAPPSRKITSACVRHNSRACEPRLLKSESLGSATRSLCTTKNRRPSPQLEKNPSSDKDPEQPKQIKLIKKEKENSPAPTILAPPVCSPSSHQARAGGRSPWVPSLSPSQRRQVTRMCLLYRYHLPPTSPSQQSPLRVPTLPSALWRVSTDGSPPLSSPQEASLPGSPHHRVGTAPVKTIDDSCASEAAGQARAFMPLEGTAGALRGGSHSLPLEDTSPDVKDSRPPLLLHPRNCPPPFPGCLGPPPALSQRQGLLGVRGH